jgi:general secretion pathway protein J
MRTNRHFCHSENAPRPTKVPPSAVPRICAHPRPSAVKLNRAAFTIIEIMTAMAIFCMVVAAIFAAWQAIMRGSVSGNRAAVNAQRSRIALSTIQQALGSTRSFVADVDYYTFEADNGNEPYLSFVSKLAPDFLRSPRFGGFEVRRITFALEQGPDRNKRLVMRQTPVLMDMDQDEQDSPVVLANNVTKFDMEFWDKKKGDWLDEWTDTNQIPQMVKFTLQLDGMSSQDAITRVVAIPAVAVQAGWQVPGSTAGGPGFHVNNGGASGGAGGFGGGGGFGNGSTIQPSQPGGAPPPPTMPMH